MNEQENREEQNKSNERFGEGVPKDKKGDKKQYCRQGKKPKTLSVQDWQWYAENERTLEALASFPFSARTGDTAKYTNGSTASKQNTYGGGITRIGVIPALGFIDEATDEATLAATAFFKTLTQGYAGYSNFQPSDVLFTNIAGAQIYLNMIRAKRAYGLVNYANKFNKYIVKHIFTAMNLDYDDWVAKKKEFIGRYNVLANNVNANIIIPSDFSLLSRWEWLLSYIFTDRSNAERATFTFADLDAEIVIDETTFNTGTALLLQFGQFSTVDEFFDNTKALLARLSDNQDFANIFGTAKRVYTESQLKRVSQLDENFLTPIGEHEAFNDALRNARYFDDCGFIAEKQYLTNPIEIDQEYFIGIPGESGKMVLAYQDSKGVIKSLPCAFDFVGKYPHTPYLSADQTVLSFKDRDGVSPAVVIDGCSWTECLHGEEYSAYAIQETKEVSASAISVRTELINSVKFFWLRGNTLVDIPINTCFTPSTTNMKYGLMHYLTQVRNPIRFEIVDSDMLEGTGLSVTLSNISVINNSSIIRMQELSFFQLLALPTNMKSITS